MRSEPFGFSSLASDAAFSPLLLTYARDGRRWTLNVQSLPRPRITLTGTQPTRVEIVEALLHTGAPCWLVPVLEVVAACAEQPEPSADRAAT